MLSFNTIKNTPSTETVAQRSERLSESIRYSLKNYFSRLGSEEPKAIYDMVLSEVEMPLLECLIHHTKNNQVKMAKWLGLSRGTTRQKLKKYGFLERSPQKNS
ncbi:MAG: fis 2, partial [Gammaproteobacteria bacterium]|nr:fis 2 [Gammaproteobacteria bacterium]